MTDRHDAGGPVDGAAAEVVTDPLDLAGVDAHAHGETDRGHLAAAPATAARSAPSTDVNAAAMPSPIVANTSPAAVVHRRPQHGEVPLDPLVHLGRLLPLTGRSLDVGEQERHRDRGTVTPVLRAAGTSTGDGVASDADVVVDRAKGGGTTETF